MTLDLRFAWQCTPDELFESLQIVPEANTRPPALETRPFQVPQLSLDGGPYTYQTTRSSISLNLIEKESQGLRSTQPESLEKRCGILFFDGDTVIASYMIPGIYAVEPRLLHVRDSYRGKGLATRLMEQVMRDIPVVVGNVHLWGRQMIHVKAVKAHVNAHKNVVQWALQEGKEVPLEVLEAVQSGAQGGRYVRLAEKLGGSSK